MIKVKNLKKCSGCGACVDACPKNAVARIQVNGFSYPEVDAKKDPEGFLLQGLDSMQLTITVLPHEKRDKISLPILSAAAALSQGWR